MKTDTSSDMAEDEDAETGGPNIIDVFMHVRSDFAEDFSVD